MNRTVLAVACGALLLAAVAVFVRFERRRMSGGDDRASEVRAGWREENRDSLMHLSAIGRLSRGEQARFDAAGDDPERMRQAMIENHEDRLTNAKLDLQDARERRAQMQGSGGYKVYADRPQGRDMVELVDGDERAATSQIALYGAALSRIRGWSPVSYETYAAASMLPGAGAPAADGEHASEASRGSDRGVPVDSAPVLVGETGPPAPIRDTRPPAAAPAEAARKPSPMFEARDTRPSGAPYRTESGGRGRAEEEILGTLRRWAGAMVLNDPKAEAAEYAPHMDRYFLRKNVDTRFVEADKAAYLRRGNVTAGFALQGVTIESETDKTADVRLVKDVTWRRGAEGETHRLIRSRLQLTRLANGWKISSEQDFR